MNKFRNNSTLWLDLWTKSVLGLNENERLTRSAISEFQTCRLNELFSYVREKSSFYAELYREFPADYAFSCPEQISELPLMGPEDLIDHEKELLCVSPREIKRIVTLETSGTSGEPKHIYFTPEDQELSIAHFQYGMQYLTDGSGKVLILLPHKRPGSVGDLLSEAVRRLGADVTFDPDDEGITCVCGMPTVIKDMTGRENLRSVETVLLTAEYVSPENASKISGAWDCVPFEHYGMTEMGLGGAVTCNHLCGYHPREHDLLFEITDPDTGEVLPDGEYGEVVFTTLTRRGMPFIRYRTGDISRFIPEPCPCGSVLRRLERVGDRKMKKGGYCG